MERRKVTKKKETKVKKTQESKTEVLETGLLRKTKSEASVESSVFETELLIDRTAVGISAGEAESVPVELEMERKRKGESSVNHFISDGDFNRIPESLAAFEIASSDSGSDGQAQDAAEDTLDAESLSKVISDKINTKIHRIEFHGIKRRDENNARLESGDTAEVSKGHKNFENIDVGLYNDISQSFSGDFASGNNTHNDLKINNYVQTNNKRYSTLNTGNVFGSESAVKSAAVQKDSTDASGENDSPGKVSKIIFNIENQFDRPLAPKRSVKDLSDAKRLDNCTKERKQPVKKFADRNNLNTEETDANEREYWIPSEIENDGGIDKESLRRSVSYLVNYFESLKNSNSKQLNSLAQMVKAIETSEVKSSNKTDKTFSDKEQQHRYFTEKQILPPSKLNLGKTSRPKKRPRENNLGPKEKKLSRETVSSVPSIPVHSRVFKDLSCGYCSDSKEKCSLSGVENWKNCFNNDSQQYIPQERWFIFNDDKQSNNQTATRNKFNVMSETINSATMAPGKTTAVPFASDKVYESNSPSGISNPKIPRIHETYHTDSTKEQFFITTKKDKNFVNDSGRNRDTCRRNGKIKHKDPFQCENADKIWCIVIAGLVVFAVYCFSGYSLNEILVSSLNL